jgi:hypothetical protein
VRNRARPEGSIAKAYVASDTLTFCSRYMQDVDNKFNKDVGDGPLVSDTSVFMHGAKIIGADKRQYIDDEMMDKLVWYVLNNCEEVEPYLE